MPNYRRAIVAGATYFFTVNLLDRRERLLVTHIEILRGAVAWVRARHPFQVHAWVVLPDHMHAVWTLPDGDGNYALRWASIKRVFSRGLARDEPRSDVRRLRGERGIWQRRYWEHLIRDERDFERHVDYVHFNPVKHGHVRRVIDWPYSTFHREVARGGYPADWAGGDGFDAMDAGERA